MQSSDLVRGNLLQLPALLLLSYAPLLAQSDPVVDSRTHYADAVRAYEARDYAGFLEHARLAHEFVRMTPDGRFSDFARLQGADQWAPLGLRVDPVRRILWVATAALPQMTGYVAADSGRSALLRFDLKTGKLGGRYPAPADGRPHALGDLAVTRDGDVYATDGRAPVIDWLAAGADSLQLFLETPLLQSGQGLAFSPDERRLYVADYSRGILQVDLATGTTAALATADTVLTLGIDGLYYHEGALIGIQNGVTPHRIVRLELSPDGHRIARSVPLERGHPHHEEPTLGTVVGPDFYYLANSQWERFGPDGRIAQPESLRPPVVLRLWL